jgi:hypothetical protein
MPDASSVINHSEDFGRNDHFTRVAHRGSHCRSAVGTRHLRTDQEQDARDVGCYEAELGGLPYRASTFKTWKERACPLKVPSGGIEPSATSMLDCHAMRRLLMVSHRRIQDRHLM